MNRLKQSTCRTGLSVWLLRWTLTCGIVSFSGHLFAQNDAPPKEAQQRLAESQKQLAERFSKLEELFLRMSEMESSTNPSRSGLLQQAAKLSKELAMTQRMQAASEMLTKKQFSRAIEEQQASAESLKKLIELLQSENRQDRVREERQKFEQWIKEIQRVERIERSLRGRTENGQDSEQASKDQADILAQAQAIGEKLEESIPKENPSTEKKPPSDPSEKKNSTDPDDKPKTGEKSDGQKSDGQKSDGQKSDGQKSDGQKSDGQKSDGQKSDGQKSDGEQGDSSSEQQPESAEKNAQKRLENAQKRMKKAEENLKQNKREEAVTEQREAEKELKEAVAELEKVLRQLREEEIERSLVALEDRFKKMLTMQVGILEETKRVNAFEGEVRIQQLEVQSSKLSLEERKLLMEGQRAMLLLQEEGSSTAFPEVLQQMLADIESVVDRLQKADVGEMTIAIEEEVVSALEEMLNALKQVQKKNEEKKKQPSHSPEGGNQGGQEESQPLVDALAELRLIKTLQVRINNRTDRLSQKLDDPKDLIGQTSDQDLRKQLFDLSTRQEKIQEVTREIVSKLNKQNQ